MTEQRVVDVIEKLASFTEPWSPRTVAVVNDYDIRVAKVNGEFTRHAHPDTDEMFFVLRGELTIRLDAGDVTLGSGQLYVVPRGVVHQPCASQETRRSCCLSRQRLSIPGTTRES